MKRKTSAIIFTLILVLTIMSGCSDNSYESYLNAVEKTENASKYSGEFSMEVNSEVNTDGLSDEELRNVNLYNNFEVENVYKSDKALGLLESNLYINFGGLGFDIKYYDDSKAAFIKMPIVEKYVYMDDLSSLNSGSNFESEDMQIQTMDFNNMSDLVSDETKEELTKLWKDAIESNNVVKGKESLIETKEGEIKATKYTIKYEDKVFKELILESMMIIYKDEKFKEAGLISFKDGTNDIEFDIDLIRKEFIDLLVIENFELNAFIDIDGYIVKEDMDFVMSSTSTKVNMLEKISVSYTSKNFNFEKDQNILIPDTDSLEFMTKEEMETGLPSLFEDVFTR